MVTFEVNIVLNNNPGHLGKICMFVSDHHISRSSINTFLKGNECSSVFLENILTVSQLNWHLHWKYHYSIGYLFNMTRGTSLYPETEQTWHSRNWTLVPKEGLRWDFPFIKSLRVTLEMPFARYEEPLKRLRVVSFPTRHEFWWKSPCTHKQNANNCFRLQLHL